MSRQLSIGQKLKAVSELPVGRGGIASFDKNDITRWCELAGRYFDTTVLTDSTCERINTLYHAHF